MIKRKVTTSKEILHNLDYDAISVTIDSQDSSVKAEKDGKKIIPAGSVLAGKSKSIFTDRSEKVKIIDNAAASGADYIDGILLTDVDVTNGDATGSCVYRGTINADKLADSSIAKKYEDLEEKLPHIQFVKGGK
ncbi:head decoration protein [Streptococcus pyogenes]|uniref:head decoration protein n=1 Tax=Streptococcus pyogenes TaxID=1314 RepID=UPI00109BB12E|nr:head decoration protein [Streptococcus pyogenes]QBX28472.1 major capsid protein [Streptococcus phage Javan454]QCK47350.1 head decoration protein [Streptococcus pyogenes]QCK52391.1 head decoration protein [Streptococcus pyogenes]VGR94976.1 structural protein [Streptococcus pyogenes]VGS59372.1 structural protein [Streptococcus pyogenes]